MILFCREFDKLSDNLQSAGDGIAWFRKEIKPIYSSNVQGLLRTKIEAGHDNTARVAGLPKLLLFLFSPTTKLGDIKVNLKLKTNLYSAIKSGDSEAHCHAMIRLSVLFP